MEGKRRHLSPKHLEHTGSPHFFHRVGQLSSVTCQCVYTQSFYSKSNSPVFLWLQTLPSLLMVCSLTNSSLITTGTLNGTDVGCWQEPVGC